MKTALVIEDQKPVREALAELLETTGWKTRRMGDGYAALEELLTTSYDLVTLDLNMPSLDGVSLVETVASQEGPNTKTPIIVVSAYLSPTVVENLKELGIHHFLEKPFVAEELLETVKRIFK